MNTQVQTDGIDWMVSHEENGSRFRWGRDGDGFVAEWVDVLAVRTDGRGKWLGCRAAPGADPDAVDKVAQGIALAFTRWLAGHPSLHAAAVQKGGAAAALVGPSGAGKSTLAEAMCRLPGVELLSDDVLLLERSGSGWLALPTESTCRLGTLPGEAKQKIAVPRAAAAGVPLRAIIDLTFEDIHAGGAVGNLRDLRGGEAFKRIAPAILRFEAARAHWGQELQNLVEIGSHARIYELSRPRDLEQVPWVAEYVADRVLRGPS
jgi:hypothetical protein